jgi:hypothetical protein
VLSQFLHLCGLLRGVSLQVTIVCGFFQVHPHACGGVARGDIVVTFSERDYFATADKSAATDTSANSAKTPGDTCAADGSEQS